MRRPTKVQVSPMVSRRIGATLSGVIRSLVAALVVVVCACATSTAVAGTRADRDGDKIFDELAAELGGAAARHEVLVSLHSPASAARVTAIERAVGDLGHVTRL